MDRVNGADWFDIGGGRRGFRGQNAALGIAGTEVTDVFLNSVQEEIVAVIEASGQVLDPKDNTQLLKALRKGVGDARSVWSQSVAGIYTFIVPEGVYKIFARVCGGGGGAGGMGRYGDGASRPAGGGGAGGYAEGWIDVQPGQQISINVGAGGQGGQASNGAIPSIAYNGFNGGTTSVGSYMSATGGGGGVAVASNAGGPGGVGSGGSIQMKGGFGTDGPGYGSAVFAGSGGASAFGGGGRSATNNDPHIVNGQAPGSGAGAVYGLWDDPNFKVIGTGGRGADGIAIIQW